MDLEEARRVLYTRLQCLEPSNVLKIMGYLLIQDIGEQDVLQLALSPDSIFQAFVAKAKSDLGLLCTPKSSSASSSSSDAAEVQQNGCIYTAVNSSNGTSEDKARQQSQQLQQPQGGPVLSLSTSMHERQSGAPNLGFEAFAGTDKSGPAKNTCTSAPPAYWSHLYELLSVQQQQQQQENMSLHQVGDYEFCGAFSATSTASVPGTGFHLPFLTRSSTSSSDVNPSPSQTAWKPCVYFARGYCKHGSGCRFLHVPGRTPSFSSLSDDSQDSQGTGADSGGFHSESLEHLEAQLRELLAGRRSPVSIASLPQLYYERFGKTLQAEGYLTESQRHGKAGFSLTKLLARLKSTVTLIDRPHGQHAVVLAEDAHKFMAYRGDSEDLGSLAVNPSSRQIYLTFPAESSFSEEDVTTHFSAYGPVQDVRIPYQQKRMFGFVTFTYSETVRTILAEGNPHHICGARVLVKPYKEKGKHGDKKSSDQQAKQLHYRNLERNRQNVLRYYLQEQVGAGRGATDEEVTAALQQKLAELHFANVQKRISETSMSKMNTMAAAPPALAPTPGYSMPKLLNQEDMNASAQDFQQQPNPYDFVMNILDGDSVDESSHGDPSKEQSGLSCTLQSDQKVVQALANAGVSSLPPTFFANDMF